ncbi:MAG: DUF4838 domain-containing protein [Thermoguttaceae bacterium]|nr:DUF4838 domain-containing protein [Thermoguttaceae bacterium]
MKARQIVLTLLLVLSAAAARSAETLTLTQDGKTDYAVVLPENAAPVQVSAANELADTLREISGVAFPIKKESEVAAGPDAKLLVIGPSETSKSLLGDAVDEAAVPYDGIVLKQTGKSIVFSGHPVRGPLYAVYTFLEDELGCRWWTETESFVPKTDRIEASDFDQVYAPKLIYREPLYSGLMGKANARIAAHLKTNGASENIPPELGGHHEYQYFVHSFYMVIKPEEFLDHPEWFSEIDGRRKVGGWYGISDELKEKIGPDAFRGAGSQLCLTNEEMFRTFLERIRKALDANPDATIVSVSQNDWDGWCECEKCSQIAEEEGSQSGPILRFVNRIAEELEKSHPNVLVDTLAYRYTRKPPEHVVARDNVIVRLCSIECSFVQNLDGEYGPSLATGGRRPTDEAQNRSFRDDMIKWSEHAEHIFVWDYVTDFAQYLIPFPNYRILRDNVGFFVRHRTIGLLEQGDYQTATGDFVQMRAWILAKLLWNPDTPLQSLYEEFLSGYYAPELTPLYLEYFDLLTDAAESTGEEIGIYRPDTLGWLDLETFNKCSALLDRIAAKAEELEKNDPDRYTGLLYKVRRERIPLDMALLQNYNAYAEQAQAEGKEFCAPPREEMSAFYGDFRARCQAAGLNLYNEANGPEKFEEYMTEVFEKIVPEKSGAEEPNAR